MNVYVSWAYTANAANAEERLVEWAANLQLLGDDKKDKELVSKLNAENCLPEYFSFQKVKDDSLRYDKLNQNLLAVRFFTPKLKYFANFTLGKRLPNSKKLPVSLAAKSYLLKTFKGEWDYRMDKPKGNLTFVGHQGTGLFLENLSYACAAMGKPFPLCFEKTQVREYSKIRDVLDAAAVNATDKEEEEKYKNMLMGWSGPGASAAKDGSMLLSFSYLMGWEDLNEENDKP